MRRFGFELAAELCHVEPQMGGLTERPLPRERHHHHHLPQPAGRTGPGKVERSGTAVVEDERALLDAYDIDDRAAPAERCVTARRALGQLVGRWRAPCLLVSIKLAVVTRG
ncbi:MAG TPA: hypothetical protein VFL94_01315 [Actinomycetales bacterium]|nr:hypothetical protein [Actinomycetales bacterium]